MVLVRIEFQCKWGRVRETLDRLKALPEQAGSHSVVKRTRVLTDLSGRFDTVVVESEVESIDAYFAMMEAMFANPEFQEAGAALADSPYQSGTRSFYTIEAAYEF